MACTGPQLTKKKKGGNALKLIKNAPECYKNMHAETHPNEKIVWTGPKCKPTVHLNTTISRNHQAKQSISYNSLHQWPLWIPGGSAKWSSETCVYLPL